MADIGIKQVGNEIDYDAWLKPTEEYCDKIHLLLETPFQFSFDTIGRIAQIALAALCVVLTSPLYLIGRIAIWIASKPSMPETTAVTAEKTAVVAIQTEVFPPVTEKAENGMVRNHFFESQFFKEKIAAQCHTHAELEAMVGLCIVLLQLIKDPSDEPVIMKAIGQLRLDELKFESGIEWNNMFEKDDCFFFNSTLAFYYEFAVTKAYDAAFSLLFPGKTAIDDKKIKDYLTECLCVYFHGTNTASLSKIAQQGMNGSLANDLQAEIDELKQAFEGHEASKTRLSLQFTYHKGQSKQVFYRTRNPLEAFNYAKGSPEWFQTYLNYAEYGSGLAHHFRYEKRDEDQATKLFAEIVGKKVKEDQWSKEQEEQTRQFFAKNWARFGQALPAVIAMPVDKEHFDAFIQAMKKIYLGLFPEHGTQSAEQFIQVIALWMANIDHLTSDQTIPPEKLSCYTFPMIKLAKKPPA